MTPQGRWQPRVVRGFEAVFRPWMRRRLGGLHLTGLDRELPGDRPLIFAANHVSWFDGFLIRELHRRLRPGVPLYTLMGREELCRNGFLRRLGVLDLDAERPAALKGLLRRLDAERAATPGMAISMFPQGRIWPASRRPLGFRGGITHLVRRLAPAVVVPVGIRFEPLTTVAPHAFVAVGHPIADGAFSLPVLESAVAGQLEAIERLLTEHGEDAPAFWPGPQGALPAAVPVGSEGGTA